jgi:7,8-dihydropterin-6-yl-methyl-4-(beta-D-ribofuranosyl)aminobenzene 5'-phosphate synthase
MGGEEIRSVITKLKITKAPPSHCTGEKPIALMRAAWGDNFVNGGIEAVIELP